MSSYDSVVGGMLKLKGNALDVKASGVKKKEKHKKHQEKTSLVTDNELSTGGSTKLTPNPDEEEIDVTSKSNDAEKAPHYDDNLTPAEKQFI
ncbi:uncharacterized protein LOC125420391 [Ziziphus jujuba]|uniref:Uncharacterized protein LOC125420391 n=1 Tax=Ziziphus jujuba TaxID=326968 RepID=A0ABM3I892_ZIZJJ|nr:uncharacterized protein LOC125420391 [Ziziphus jujuba]